jgi:putative DNA primase/helicase
MENDLDFTDYGYCFNCKNFNSKDCKEGEGYCLKRQNKKGSGNLLVTYNTTCYLFDMETKQTLENYQTLLDIKKKRNKNNKEDFIHLKEAAAVITAYRDYLDLANQFWKIQPFFYNTEGIWWLWNFQEFKWEIVDETSIMNEIDTALQQPYTIQSKVKNEILEALKRVGRKRTPKDAPLRWIQFKDQAFSLRSNKIHKITPDYFFTNPIPFSLGDKSDTPILDKLFKEWVGEDYLNDLYELIAYCCYRGYPIQSLICLYGFGRNGKSSFLKILDKFIGTDNITTTELDLLVGQGSSRFESFKFYKKLVCLMGETNFGVLDKSSILKKLVGGDKIGFEMKNKLPFTEYNYAKIIIASNSLPTSEDTSEGFYRRWHIIDFPNEFPEGKDITLTIPTEEYNNLAKKCIKILPLLLERGMFTNQGTIQERKEKYQMASNPLPKFFEIFCVQKSEGYIRYSECYTAYCKFLSKNKRRIVSRKEFSKYLSSEGYENRKTSKDGMIDYYIENLDWREDLHTLPDLLDFSKFHISITHRKTNSKILENEENEEKVKTEDLE